MVEVRANKSSRAINPETNGFHTTTNGRSGGLLARTESLSGHPSKKQARSTLLVPLHCII
ncbi:hypothetical protein J6590_047558 [Homalodisca vitripennis]|nr:hypothetical protein J6590_047558 [Homalodisca vitripennis]